MKNRSLTAAAAAVTLLVPAATYAQTTAVVPMRAAAVDRFVVEGTPAQSIEILMAEPLGDEPPVKGAPFSAEAVTELTQTLADGNRIERTFTTMLWRDSQGRTRREQQIVLMGPLAAAGVDAPRTVTIVDPVAGQVMNLDASSSTARRAQRVVQRVEGVAAAPGAPILAPAGGLGTGSGAAGTRARAVTREDVVITRGESLRTLPSQAVGDVLFEAAVPVAGVAAVPGVAGVPFAATEVAMPGVPAQPLVQESLGTRVIEGLVAEGTRTTMTIPAGAIGNLAPIDVVTERWFSKELQTAVMITRRDPRSGETVYRLTNIVRAEPPAELFTTPPDFKVLPQQ